MTTLTKQEQADLRQVLESPLMRKAMDEAMDWTFREHRGAVTLETCAMNYNHNEGAFNVLNKLRSLAEMKEERSGPSTARRFRPTHD